MRGRLKQLAQRARSEQIFKRRVLAGARADEQDIFKIFLPEKFRRRREIQK